MKRKFKLLGSICALLMGVTMTFTACGKTEVAEHDHAWNSGEVTTEATCHSEGVMTYTCTVDGCGQTKTEPIAMTAHTWNDGEVTKAATCKEEGAKTYTCIIDGCGGTKEEAVDKTDHKWNEGAITKTPDFYTKGVKTYTCLNCDETKAESVAAHADFAEQYVSSASKSNWQYGYTQTFNAETNEAEFKVATPTDGVWKADGVEIGKGHVYSAKYAMIAYTFNEEVPIYVQSDILVSFNGDESNTVLKAYLLITAANGEVKGRYIINGENKKDWSYQSENAIDIAQGYTFWFVFENAGAGKAGGNIDIVFTAPCVHVWTSTGTVKKAATCTEEGVIEYSCINCDVKRTETLDKVPHDYEGKVTKEPTETEDGLKTYTCKNCNDTYTEVIPKLSASEFTGANFADDFELTDNGEFNGWTVGKVSYNFDAENFTFTKITAKNGAGDAYNDNTDGWKEIKGNWMAVNGMMGFAYRFEAAADVTVNFVLNGKNNSSFSVRWALKDINGNIKLNDGKASWGGEGKDITLKEDITVAYGDMLYILVNKEGENDQCDFSLVLKPQGQEDHPVVPFEGANFAEDFELNDEGEFNGWTVGKVSYDFDAENFTFTKINELNGNGDCYHSNEPWMDIKGDWMAVNGMMGFAYHFYDSADVTISFVLNGKDNSKFSIRWALKDKNGNIKLNDGKASWGGEGKDIILNEDITVEYGDVLYILVNKEGENDQCDFSLVLKVQGQEDHPVVPFEGANFAEDFELNDEGEFNGWTVGKVSYDFDAENFTFTKINELNGNGDCYHSNEPWMDIKGDWMAVNGMMGFAYHFYDSADVTISFVLNGKDNSKFSIRWALKDKKGNIKLNDGKASWGGEGKDITLNEDITVEYGDVLYILVNKDGENDQCDFSLVLSTETEECTHEHMEDIPGYDATCTAKGKTKGEKCSDCGKILVEQQDIELKDHTYGDWINKVDATCSATGKLAHYECSVCHKNFDADKKEIADITIAIDSDAHDWNEGEVTTQPTCTANGVKTFTCKHDEEHTKTEDVAIDANAHKWGEWQTVTRATCVKEGKEERVCEHNSEHKDPRTTAIDPAAHDVDASAITINPYPTFDTAGTATTGACKNNCGKYSGGTVVLPKLDDEKYTVTNNTATCTDGGKGKYTIEVDGVVVSFEADTLAKGHNLGEWIDEVEATCTKTGTLAHYECSVCNKNFDAGKEEITDITIAIDANAHDWAEEWTTGDGKHWHICNNGCSEINDEDEHEWSATKATLTSAIKCEVCDEIKEGGEARSSVTFAEDFELNDSGEFAGWQVGVVDYIWGAENFNFTKITAKNGAGDAYNDSTHGWKEIKGDWMALDEMMGFAYHFYDSAYINFDFVLKGKDGGNFTLRWALKDSNGNIKTNGGKAKFVGGGKDLSVNSDILVKDGDVLYILPQRDGGSANQFDFTLILTKYEKLADFGNDFADTLAGENTGWECGVVEFRSDADFTFNAFGETNAKEDMFHSDAPWVDFKGDWIAAKTMVGIKYTFGEAASIRFNFIVNCAGDGQCAVRWALKDKDGNIKTNNGNATWGDMGSGIIVSGAIEVEEGDELYILISYEKDENPEIDRNDQKNFTFAIAKNKD